MDDFIRNTPALEAACATIAAGGLCALDTEFVWRRTFRPRLCIAQLVGADGNCHVVDCIFCTNPFPLGAVIANPDVVKIVHAANQDLLHMRHYTGAFPKNVFDTQRAAAFAGFSAGASLKSLLFDVLEVGLPKTETLTDWSQRPLTQEQLQYAADDVRYLAPLRDELLKRAEALGTRAWLDDEMRRFDDASLYEDERPEEAWRRIRTGRRRLEPIDCAALRALAAERERKALLWNLPRLWLGDDDSLLELALDAGDKGPGGSFTPREIHFSHRLRENHKRDALALSYAKVLTAALASPREEWPEQETDLFSRELENALDKAMDFVRKTAEEIHLDPVVLATRSQVKALLAHPEDEGSLLLQGWRRERIGEPVVSRFATAQ